MMSLKPQVWTPSEQQLQQLSLSHYGRPKEHREGYSTGWPKFDAVFKPTPAETTLVLPGLPAGYLLDSSGFLLEDDVDGAVSLVFEEAIGLASKARCHFRIFAEEVSKEEIFHVLQNYNPYQPDITWILEHFSVEILTPGVQLGERLAKLPGLGFLRGIIYLGGSSDYSSLLTDVQAIKECTQKTGAVTFIVARLLSPSVLQCIEDVCDNCLLVRASDPCGCQVGSSLRRRYEVTPRKLEKRHHALWPCGGPGGAPEPIHLRAPTLEERLAT